MALKDSFINLNKALRTTLQNVPAVVDTLIRGFDEVADVAEAEGTYSTTEKVVGKWIDGSDVYEKVIDVGALPSATSKSVPHNIADLDNMISLVGAAKNSSGDIITLPYASPSIPVYIALTSTNIIILTTSATSANYSGYVIIRYTKSTSNRAPENDTRNGGDEPVDDVKTVEEPAEELKK